MAYEMRPGQGSLFRNDKKTSDNHPSMKGKVMLPNGEVRWISAWTKQTSSGDKWISLSIGDLVQQQGGGMVLDSHNQAKGNAYVQEADDDIPF